MRLKPAALVLVSALTLGALAGALVHGTRTDQADAARPSAAATTPTTAAGGTSSPTTAAGGTSSPTTAPVAEDAAADADVLAPGRAGPLEVGMSKDEALATGLLDADVPGSDGCPDQVLAWKRAHRETFDVQTLGNGEVSSIGVRGRKPRTAAGLGVGSTAAEVRGVVDEDTAQEVGFGQSGLFEFDGQTGRWIGYLFNTSPERLKGSDEVSFVELTKGVQPELVRSGC
ncbi:hypothetical protein [Aeromicrobium massiliense]|uniref:hypothetical protein n=1 Tax=Aeromicrobium massiliense TaxID=1464554 RepID=UPI000578314A|nr:hypothetical protein [Aeromicrobium massiliense]